MPLEPRIGRRVGVMVGQKRGGPEALAINVDREKKRAEQRAKLIWLELFHMKRILEVRKHRINTTIGRGDHEHPVRLEHASYFAEKQLLLADMLDGLERDHHVEARIARRDRRTTPHGEGQIRNGRKSDARSFNAGAVDVDANHTFGRLSKNRRANPSS